MNTAFGDDFGRRHPLVRSIAYNMACGMGILATIGAIFLAVGLMDALYYSGQETTASAYADITTARTICPAVGPKIDEAMADGHLNRREARSLMTATRALSDAYGEVVDMRGAKAALRLPLPSLPPRCRNTMAGKAFPLFHDY